MLTKALQIFLLLCALHAIAPAAPLAPVSAPSDSASTIDEAANDKATCDKKWLRYYKSQECFAPYHNINGTMKPGAFQHCKQVSYPAECPLQPPRK